MTNQINNQSIIPSTDVIQLTLTLKMTTARVVETSVTVTNNSPIQDYVHPDDQTQPTFMIYTIKKEGLYQNKVNSSLDCSREIDYYCFPLVVDADVVLAYTMDYIYMYYCAFHKHANSAVQKPTDVCVFRCRQSS